MTLDLGPFDAAMARLENATSAPATAPHVLREGERLAEAWRANVAGEGLIRTGAYHGSIRAEVEQASGEVTVRVMTDLGYPSVHEYGSPTVPAAHVAGEAFTAEQEQIVERIAEAIRQAIG